MERYPGTRAVYLADGDPPQVGETMKQPELALTLQLLADKGFDGFYRGDVAAKLLASVRAEGGRWTAADLKAALEARDRQACGPVAPADGLYLTRVAYDQPANASK